MDNDHVNIDQAEKNIEEDLDNIRARIKRWFFKTMDTVFNKVNNWREKYDICEICKKYPVELTCSEGCGKRICPDCQSFFYEDATICVECRAKITPEMEAEIQKEAYTYLKMDCACPEPCELDEEEHESLRHYEAAQVQQ